MDQTGFEIRRYQPSDHDAVWELHNTALHAVQAHAGSGPWDDDLHDIETVYLAARGEFLVGMLAGELVAMGALKRMSATRAEIKRMRVQPALQGRGFGQAILTALEQRARALGYRQLFLETTLQQQAARRLYAKNSFVAVRYRVLHHFHCITYKKKLA